MIDVPETSWNLNRTFIGISTKIVYLKLTAVERKSLINKIHSKLDIIMFFAFYRHRVSTIIR